jgi:hypothetical protein
MEQLSRVLGTIIVKFGPLINECFVLKFKYIVINYFNINQFKKNINNFFLELIMKSLNNKIYFI